MRLLLLITVGAVVVMGVWLFREPLRRQIFREVALANDAPSAEVVENMIDHASDPRAALVAAWGSGKIMHREVAIRMLSRVIPPEQPLTPELDSLLLSAALDPDLNVRESALGTLQQRRHPALTALAATQLRDADPQVRLLGLRYLRSASPASGVPAVIPLLDDAEPLIVIMCLKLLENWSGQSFGVRLSETTPFENEGLASKEDRKASLERARAGAERAKAWWTAHRSAFPPVELKVPGEAYSSRQVLSAPDFQLSTLDGRKVRLSDSRGKVVLINFWTTWCPPCANEIPALIALQSKCKDSLTILGISLDCVPHENAQIGGHASGDVRSAASLKKIRDKVARTVEARGVNYPILLDKRNEAGGRYNGAELPTTVIVDAQGRVQRRFVGPRSLSVFEAMVAEAVGSK